MDKLRKVREEIGVIGKNTQAYNYKYADLEKIMEKLSPLLEKYELGLYSYVRDNALCTAVFDVSEEDKVIATSSIPLTFAKGATPQDLGSAMTYFRRYNILALFEIVVAGEDDDAGASQAKAVKTNNDAVPVDDIAV